MTKHTEKQDREKKAEERISNRPSKKGLDELIKERIVFADGAMGTMLYEYGAFINVCFEELNITRPDLVLRIHKEYIEAGVDFIETNTFGANPIKLSRYGLADQTEAICKHAVLIAKKAIAECNAEESILIAGSIGPLGKEFSQYSILSEEEARSAFSVQIRTLLEAGADFLIFETFSSAEELILAIRTAYDIDPTVKIIAQFTVNENGLTKYGLSVCDFAHKIETNCPDVLAIGLNCSIGPADMLSNIERLLSCTTKPVSAMPNAGMPREVDGRRLYMCTPEYMAEYAKRFYEKGVRIIGGCCGTGPRHISEIIKAVRALEQAQIKRDVVIKTHIERKKEKARPLEPIPIQDRSRLGRKLSNSQLITTVEITPPRGFDLTGIIEKVKKCASHRIDAINIPDGPRASARLSPLITAVKIQQACDDIEAILHVCCRDRNLIGLQSDLLGAYAMGIRNLLIITGDPPKLGEYPDATAVFDVDSIGLVSLVNDLNRGIDIAGNQLPAQLGFLIGVGANPVAYDINREIDRFKKKVEAGAEYAITQPIFDPDMLFRFLDAIAPYRIPIIAGIWPFTSYKNAEFMANEVPGVVVPKNLLEKMSKARTKEEGKKLGIEIARQMVEKVLPSVQGFAVSAPFGDVDMAIAVLDGIVI